jgi:hypothetical protein
VFDTHEEIVVLLFLRIIDQTTELLFCILLNSRVLEVIFFHPNWIKYSFILPRLQISRAKALDLAERLKHEFELDVFSCIVEIFLYLFLGLEPVPVLGTKVNTQLFILPDDIEREDLQL